MLGVFMRWSKMHFITLGINTVSSSPREKKNIVYKNILTWPASMLCKSKFRLNVSALNGLNIVQDWQQYILIPFWSTKAWQNQCFHNICACFSSENYILSYLSIDLIPPNNNMIEIGGHIKRNSQTITTAFKKFNIPEKIIKKTLPHL